MAILTLEERRAHGHMPCLTDGRGEIHHSRTGRNGLAVVMPEYVGTEECVSMDHDDTRGQRLEGTKFRQRLEGRSLREDAWGNILEEEA